MRSRIERVCVTTSTFLAAHTKFVFPHPQASTPRTSLFFSIHKPRRPEQVCFSPSTSLDAPNKFVFLHPQASTPRTSLFLPIHKPRRPEQVCFCPSTSLDAPNKFIFRHPQASTPRTKTHSGSSGKRCRVPGCTRDFNVVVAQTALYSVVRCDNG